ncbi:hypothetical protein BJY01DRAFT_111306 [Aspergillus pseudoustus]|uniref:Uncharacterized protein n=1 Tax=Aspergillus pseudoustus TaxID=1810923 RepID=A0ABR4IV62_9EURO
MGNSRLVQMDQSGGVSPADIRCTKRRASLDHSRSRVSESMSSTCSSLSVFLFQPPLVNSSLPFPLDPATCMYACQCPIDWKREIINLLLISSAYTLPFVSPCLKSLLTRYRVVVQQRPAVYTPQQSRREAHLQRPRKPPVQEYNVFNPKDKVAPSLYRGDCLPRMQENHFIPR